MQEKPYANRNCEINKQQNENSSEKEENKKRIMDIPTGVKQIKSHLNYLSMSQMNEYTYV